VGFASIKTGVLPPKAVIRKVQAIASCYEQLQLTVGPGEVLGGTIDYNSEEYENEHKRLPEDKELKLWEASGFQLHIMDLQLLEEAFSSYFQPHLSRGSFAV
jgi:hypothetical protein